MLIPTIYCFTPQLSLRFTTEVASDCVLGLQANSLTDKPTEIFEKSKNLFAQSTSFIIYTALASIFPFVRKFWNMKLLTDDSEQFFLRLMNTALELRVKNPMSDRLDFLNYMLELKQKKNLPLQNLTAHTVSFLTDGFETSSLVMSHTLLLVSFSCFSICFKNF